MEDILIPLAFFTSVVLIVYFLSKYKYLIKMAIIEKGGLVEFPKKRMPFLEIGYAFIGFGIGLAIYGSIINLKGYDPSMVFLGFGLPLVFGGLGLVIAFFTRRRLERKDNK